MEVALLFEGDISFIASCMALSAGDHICRRLASAREWEMSANKRLYVGSIAEQLRRMGPLP